MKFLLIPDNQDLRSGLRAFFEKSQGHSLRAIESPQEISSLEKEEFPDFIFLSPPFGEMHETEILGFPFAKVKTENSKPEFYEARQGKALEDLENTPTQSYLERVQSIVASTYETPNGEYLSEMTGSDPELKREMLLILQAQFLEAREKIPYFYSQSENEPLIQIIHKAVSKFSILGMQFAFNLLKNVETYLKEGKKINPPTIERVNKCFDTANEFIEQQLR